MNWPLGTGPPRRYHCFVSPFSPHLEGVLADDPGESILHLKNVLEIASVIAAPRVKPRAVQDHIRDTLNCRIRRKQAQTALIEAE